MVSFRGQEVGTASVYTGGGHGKGEEKAGWVCVLEKGGTTGKKNTDGLQGKKGEKNYTKPRRETVQEGGACERKRSKKTRVEKSGNIGKVTRGGQKPGTL